MAEGNSNNSVRDRISMLVDAQEDLGESGQGDTIKIENDDKKVKKRSFFLGISIAILAVLLVGLAIAIVMIKPWEEDETEEIIANMNNSSIEATGLRNKRRAQALDDCMKVRGRFEDGDLDYKTAREEFNEMMLKSDPVYDVSFAICYAGFLQKYDNDLDASILIMEKVEQELRDLDIISKINYYVMMRSLYRHMGNSERVDYYNSIVEELMIEDVGDFDIETEDGDNT